MKTRHWHPQVSSALLIAALSLGVGIGGLAADSTSGPPSTPQIQQKVVPKSPGPNAPSPVGTPTPLLPSAVPRISPVPPPDRVPLLPPPGSAPASPTERLDGPLPHPRYSDGAGGWSTKSIKEDIRQAIGLLDVITKIGRQGSAPADPNSLDPETRAATHGGGWTQTNESVPALLLIQRVIVGRLNTVPKDMLLRAIREIEIEKLKLPPFPPGPEDPPGTFIKVDPIPVDPRQRAKPPGNYWRFSEPVPIVPLAPGSPITHDPGAWDRWMGPNWDYEWAGEGNSSSLFVGPIGGRGVVQQGPASPWGGGPRETPDRPGQRDVVPTPGGSPGGQSAGPQPGQGGTLVGSSGASGGVSGGGGLALVPGGASQKGSSGQSGGTGGDMVGVRGGGGGEPSGGGTPQKGKGDGGSKGPAPGGDKGGSSSQPTSAGGSVPANPYDSVPENPYGSDDSNQGSSSSTSERTTTGRGGKRASADDSHEHQASIEIEMDNPLPPELDPHGTHRGGNDLGGLPKIPARPAGVTQQDVDLVGPAFRKVAGADDKERPATGAVSGTVAGDPTESRTNDVGGLHRPRTAGGGEAGSALEILLKQLGLWDKWQAGGPDPAK